MDEPEQPRTVVDHCVFAALLQIAHHAAGTALLSSGL